MDSEEVKEEGQGGAEGGLQVSQPQPTLNYLITEEYTSD